MKFAGLICSALALIASGCVYHHEVVRERKPEGAAAATPAQTVGDGGVFTTAK